MVLDKRKVGIQMFNFEIDCVRNYYYIADYQGVVIEERNTREKKILFVIDEEDSTFIEFSETGLERYTFTDSCEEYWYNVIKEQYSNYDIIKGIESFEDIEQFSIKFSDED